LSVVNVVGTSSDGTVGTSGASGVTAFEAVDATEVPPGPSAVTVTVYEVPAAAPSTQLVPVLVHVAGPGSAVAV
jgi:hypothetical protein